MSIPVQHTRVRHFKLSSRHRCVYATLLTLLAFGPLACSDVANQISLTLAPAASFSTLTTTASATQTVTLTNNSRSSADIHSIAVTGASATDFTQSNTCGKTLAPGASCGIAVVFASTTAGTFSASLTVTDNGPFGGSQSVVLTGTAVVPTPAATLSASAVTFPSLAAGGTSASQTVTLTDSGTAALSLTGLILSGTGANLFHYTSTCGSTLAVGASCTIATTFAPRIAGAYAASIVVADNASPAMQTIALAGTATASPLTIDTTTATDWKISNGTLSIDYNSTTGHIFGMTLAGFSDQLVDATNLSSNGQPQGFYMDNSGFGSAAAVSNYSNNGTYLDWYTTYPSSATNAYTYTEHFILTPNDPGFHIYFVANHATTDIAGSIGQVQWVFRENLNDFTSTYSVDPSVNNPGATITPLPPASENFTTAAGRAVQDATVDLHGLPVPTGYTRSFYTKYDYSSYNYLHQAHGVYGSNLGVWSVLPSNESLVGGPTKQNLIFTGNLLITEAYSNHYDNPLTLTTPAGTASSRLFGPFYIHFNSFGQAYTSTGNTLATPADLYADALATGNSFGSLYNSDTQLTGAGYVPSTGRGKVQVQVNGVTGQAKTAWAVLSDPAKNFQFSAAGAQYWADISTAGTATFSNVIPGTYRLSVYSLGQWGELRQDGINVTANSTTTVPAVSFVPENFGTTVFTIGTPDRSSHEFLHGHDAQGFDDREFWGTWNYWADFATNNGSVVYNATAGPAGAATNDLTKWNYNHWGTFDPGLFGGVYNVNDNTTDGYTYAIPAYVAGLTGAAGTNGVTTRTPAWQVHFATPANVANYQYAVLSVALACDYGSYVTNLNGTARTWCYRATVESDCSVRSGLSGYTQWIALQFPISALNGAGLDNLLTIGVSQTYGAMDDAIRLELTNTSAAPATTGWNDYEYVGTSSTSANIQANDAVPNP
jgi:hypothetical protein